MIDIETQLNTAAIQQQLDSLADDLKVKAVKAGINKVAASGVKLMRAYIPKKTGALQKAVRRKQLSKTMRGRMNIDKNLQAVIVGPNYKGKGRIANILEGGAKPHKIKAKKGGLLFLGRRLFVKSVNHPGTRAYKFIKRANDENNANAQSLFYTGVTEYLQRRNHSQL